MDVNINTHNGATLVDPNIAQKGVIVGLGTYSNDVDEYVLPAELMSSDVPAILISQRNKWRFQ